MWPRISGGPRVRLASNSAPDMSATFCISIVSKDCTPERGPVSACAMPRRDSPCARTPGGRGPRRPRAAAGASSGTAAPWLLGAQASRTLDITNDFTTVFSNGPLLGVTRRPGRLRLRGPSGCDGLCAAWMAPGRRQQPRTSCESKVAPRTIRATVPDSRTASSRRACSWTTRCSARTATCWPARICWGRSRSIINPGYRRWVCRPGRRRPHSHYEAAGGSSPGSASMRESWCGIPWGPFTALGRMDAGMVDGTVIPPQQLSRSARGGPARL